MKRNNVKKIGILCFLLFLFGLPIINSAVNKSLSDGKVELKTSSSVNFYAISESDLTTRWILQGAEISAFEDFHDNISVDYWNLVDVSDISMFMNVTPTDDAYVSDINPDTNYGSNIYIGLYTAFGDTISSLLKYDYGYLDLNYTSNSTFYCYKKIDTQVGHLFHIYHTSDFSESTVTWNNQPATGTIQNEYSSVEAINTWVDFDIGAPNEYYKLIPDSADLTDIYFYSTEGTFTPKISHNISKNYYGGGYMYMQTNKTELISLKSIDYTTHYNLSSGDYFEVDFQTSSDSKIELILLKDGGVNKTLTLSQSGNTNFDRHTAQISVDEFVEFDQLKISSTFEDTDNVKVYDIKTKKYTITGDYADFYVGSKRTHLVNLTSDTYNMRIFEEGNEKINENVTIGTSDYFYVYTPIMTQYCRLTLFNTENIHLEFTDYHIKVNRSLNGVYYEFWLLDSLFCVDKETYVYISVYDRFDTLIDTFERLASDYIDLELEVYQLQIKNLMTQKTTLDINSSYTYPLLSGDSIYFILSVAHYQIGYYDTNDVYKQFTIYLDSNQAYELNRSRICFLSYADQQGNHLFFDNYKTYLNDSLIYEKIFYREIGDIVGIEIKDRYDISIKNETYTVISGDNYIPITLTIYSLKLMNLQLVFNHINITRDIAHYDSEMYWSEWIAPREIIDFRLFAGYYTINLTSYENGGGTVYDYTLNGDDAILIGSNNTIYDVLISIANVNTTIGNQITNVLIDITNQNSYINNSIINIDIDLGNINSTLGNMLVNLDLDITNVANNITSLYTFTNNSFINIDNVINNSFIYMENNIISINQSISNLVIGVSNDIYLINGTISTMISQLENNLLLMNVSIDTALFGLDTTLNLIGSNITSNFILLNNSIDLTNLNINDSRIAIINNLALINNTISTLIADVYSAVYMINNSIYTAVVDLGTYLSLVNNSISGNLSIVLEQNEFLTELYQMTMFSDLLNWTDIGLNISLLTSQVDAWTFINNYKNQSIEVHLRYQDVIEKLIVSADDLMEQYLPNKDVDYRLWSVADEEYLDNWTVLPENKTVSFGFFETDVPITPEPILPPDMVDFLMFLAMLIPILTIIVGSVLYFKIRKGANRTTKATTLGKYSAFSLSRDSLKYKIKKIKKGKTPIIVGVLAILVMMGVMIFFILRMFGIIT